MSDKNQVTVFVTDEDPRYDYSAAFEFGTNLVGVFPPGQIHLSPQAALIEAALKMGEIKAGDYVALSGDPVKIAICAVVAASRCSKVQFLRFNRHTKTYIPIAVDFQDPAADLPL